jgi:hypothetical protein
VVIGRHHRESFRLHELDGSLVAILRRRSRELDARAESFGAFALRERDRGRHDDDRFATEDLRGQRHRLRVVTRRRRDHAPGAFVGSELGEEIIGATKLECAAPLQHLGLIQTGEPICSETGSQGRGEYERLPAQCERRPP